MIKYGVKWPDNATPIQIERSCIRKGGKWTMGNQECGAGLFHHYLEFQKLLWPWKDWHRWNLLILEEIVTGTNVGFLGPASSGKSHEVAAYILADYFCFPECTTALVSSTTLQMLDLRIWGEIKKLFSDAKSRHPWVPGHLNETRHRITTVSGEMQVKDFRNGIQGIACLKGSTYVGLSNYAGIKNKRFRIAGDECFVAGTLVDTPNGPVPIETIRPGDEVISALGPSKVRGTFRKRTDQLYRIKTHLGREFVCTGNHPFLTQFGFIEACKLSQSHYIISANEAMRFLQCSVQGQRQQSAVPNLLESKTESDVLSLSGSVCRQRYWFNSEILQSELRRQMENDATRIQSQSLLGGIQCQKGSSQGVVAQKQSGTLQACGSEVSGPYTGAESGEDQQVDGHVAGNGPQAEDSRRQRNWSHGGGSNAFESHAGTQVEPSDSDGSACGFGISDLLQSRLGVPGIEVGRGTRWVESFDVFKDLSRSEKDAILGGDWVDSCEVLEPEDFQRHRTSGEGVEVYTLQVERHHSYSVSGLLTKNCQFMPRSFVDTFQNLSKTPEDFKAMGMGNPKDQTDALGVMCEPVDGWDTADRSELTKVWKSRMPNTRVIQLVGTDGPNKGSIDGKEPYPYLIKPRQIEEDRKYYGPNSIQFSMMDLGMMPVGGMSNRVITKAMCETNRAKEMPIFADKVTKVLGLDAAYGTLGGDRCVAIELWFGKDTEGTDIVAVHGLPLIVPVHFRKSDTPENQIVKWVRAHCENGQIAPGNVFFDSTGRGTLGTAFGRIWSTDVNPVEFGGNASERRVSGVDQRKCSEVYGKFVTELWYQVRNAIESKQFRGITDEIIDDGTCREYMMIDKKKVDVESKKITKQRMGRSPDIFDALVTAFEGARQRGFVISGLLRNAGRGPTLWQKTAEQYQQTWQRKRLTYGTKLS